jgi:hypothetical protein
MKHFSSVGCWLIFAGLILVGVPAFGQYSIQYFDDTKPGDVENPAPQPGAQPAPAPASLGQQPFPAAKEEDLTPSQTNSFQLNQLFQFETTPNMCAAGEAYVTFDFNFLKFPGSVKEYRYQLQGQYGVTDQIALGGIVPGITAQDVASGKLNHTYSGVGDIALYGQYKLDQFISPEIVDVSVQVDLILPTGNSGEMRDTGRFGVRPLILAYKDFGQQGPGYLGVYGLVGFTFTTNSDFRFGVAGTYQINDWVGIFEFYDQDGIHGHPYVQVTPGLTYRGFLPWELSIGVPVGVTKGTPDWGIIAKVTYAFAK